MSSFHLDTSISDRCGITLSDSVESRVIAEIMSEKTGVDVLVYPAMIRIDGVHRLEFDMDEISEALGRDYDPYSFQVEVSTHYGRMIVLDDRVILFASPEDAEEYLEMELSE